MSRYSLFVCRTCPRDGYDTDGRVGASSGSALVAAVKALAASWRYRAQFHVLGVHCLGGCPKPCNAAIAAPGRERVRLQGLGPADAAVVLEHAERYFEAASH